MKCSKYKENLTQYIEGNLSAELDEKMREHILSCDSCKESYERELMEYKAFKDMFSQKGIELSGFTDKVMNSIDRSKYTKKTNILKRNHKNIIAIAAVLALGIIVTPLTMSLINNKNNEISSASMNSEDKLGKSQENINPNDMEGLKIVPDMKSKDISDDSRNKLRGQEYNYVEIYSRIKVSPVEEISFNTPFISTLDNKYEGTIDGKGKTASEEGIGKIYIKDTVNNEMYKYEISDPNNLMGNQISPLSISWYDNTHIMIIQGGGYGTLVNGEEIIIMDITTGEQILIGTALDKERFVSIEKVGNDLKIKLVKYLNDDLTEYKEVEKIVPEYKLGDIIK
ncbi:MAG: DUF4652 domain-containing protein [Clostridium sp.]|uniref:DUF4652 domain-containing protein n=1 Tax=Clostridium sp. TaxID=1506 RepID=UPI00302B859E